MSADNHDLGGLQLEENPAGAARRMAEAGMAPAQPLVAHAIPRNKVASVAAGDEPETILNFKGQSCMTQFNALFLKVSPLGWATQTRREIGLFPSPLIPPRSSSAPHLSFRSHATTFSRHLFPHLYHLYQPPRSDLI